MTSVRVTSASLTSFQLYFTGKKRVLQLWLVIAAPSQFLNFRRGDLDRVREGRGGEGWGRQFTCFGRVSFV